MIERIGRVGPRAYTGRGTALEANARYQSLVAVGATDLDVAFDLPTRHGHDSDAPGARGEVGRAGVAVDSLEDMRVLLRGIPLDRVTTSLAIDAPAAPLLLLYHLVAEERGVEPGQLAGAVSNDVLKAHTAPGPHCRPLFPPGPSLRLATDTLRYCAAELPRWTGLSVHARHRAAGGASPAQEVAFTLADGIAYIRSALAAGMGADDVVSRLSFSFVARATVKDEVAKFRAARRIWVRVLKEEFDAGCFMDVMAGAELVAGAPGVEAMTDAVEAEALAWMARIEELGGAAEAVERGFQKAGFPHEYGYEHEHGYGTAADPYDSHAPYDLYDPYAAPYDDGELPFPDDPFLDDPFPSAPFPADPPHGSYGRRQAERLAKLRAWRCHERVEAALGDLGHAAADTGRNVLHPMKDALAAGATVGEVCAALRETWGAAY